MIDMTALARDAVYEVATLAEVCPTVIVRAFLGDGRSFAVASAAAPHGVLPPCALRLAAQHHAEGCPRAAWFGMIEHFELGGAPQPVSGAFSWVDDERVTGALLTGLDQATVVDLLDEAPVPGLPQGAVAGQVVSDGLARTCVLRVCAEHPMVTVAMMDAALRWAASACSDLVRFRATDPAELPWSQRPS